MENLISSLISNMLPVMGIGIASSVLFAYIEKYLNNTKINKTIPQIIKKLENIDSNNIDDEKEKIIDFLKKETMQETSNQDTPLTKEEGYFLHNQQMQTINRLNFELESLIKRGNLNLTIGIVTAVTGLFLLSYFTLTIKITSTSLENFFIEFLPRFSLVVLVEIFAYFFLRLYKMNLAEIKYIQNEITSVEFKFLGLHMLKEDKDISPEILNNLINTERNFIIEKGQTTIDIEKLKAEEQSTQNMLGKVSNLLVDNKKE